MTQLNIQNVTADSVEVSGQPLTRSYAETIMLPMLITGCAKDFTKAAVILKQFHEAGLSLKSVPVTQVNYYFQTLEEQRQVQAHRQRDAEAHAARCRVQTPQDIAERKAERLAKEATIRAHFASLRSQQGGGTGW